MKTKVNKLIQQIRKATKMGEEIILASGLKNDGVVYCFATSKVLVINCRDYGAIWGFEEEYVELRKAIANLEYSIDTILLELRGKVYYEF